MVTKSEFLVSKPNLNPYTDYYQSYIVPFKNKDGSCCKLRQASYQKEDANDGVCAHRYCKEHGKTHVEQINLQGLRNDETEVVEEFEEQRQLEPIIEISSNSQTVASSFVDRKSLEKRLDELQQKFKPILVSQSS